VAFFKSLLLAFVLYAFLYLFSFLFSCFVIHAASCLSLGICLVCCVSSLYSYVIVRFRSFLMLSVRSLRLYVLFYVIRYFFMLFSVCRSFCSPLFVCMYVVRYLWISLFLYFVRYVFL